MWHSPILKVKAMVVHILTSIILQMVKYMVMPLTPWNKNMAVSIWVFRFYYWIIQKVNVHIMYISIANILRMHEEDRPKSADFITAVNIVSNICYRMLLFSLVASLFSSFRCYCKAFVKWRNDSGFSLEILLDVRPAEWSCCHRKRLKSV